MSRQQDFTLRADDGYSLCASLHQPESGEAVIATVVMNSATGVRRQYYGKFAAFLAQRGFVVLTYDFRGMAESSPENLRKFSARVCDWPQLDTPAAIGYLKEQWPTHKLYLIGHSAGGNLLGLVRNLQQVDAAMFVGAQFGYWRLWPRRLQPLMAFVFYFVVPVSSGIFGYVPRWMGAGQHWPRRIALELARWCRDPHYIFGDKSLDTSPYASFGKSILAFSFADDPHASKQACDALLARFPRADVEHRHVSPAMLKISRIGHFGFFTAKCEPLWKECGDWIAAKASQ